MRLQIDETFLKYLDLILSSKDFLVNPKAVELVNEHGDQAYHVAVEFTVLATHIGDTVGADLFGECARNLMEAGYHKHRKRK